MIRSLALAGLLLSGCSATPTDGAARLPTTDPPASTTASKVGQASTHPTAQAICRSALPDRTVLAWESTTVARLRAYQYGGPTPRVPLRHAFPAVPGGHGAVWCWVREGSQSGSLWGVMVGGAARHAVTISGPSTTPLKGPMNGPPRPP